MLRIDRTNLTNALTTRRIKAGSEWGATRGFSLFPQRIPERPVSRGVVYTYCSVVSIGSHLSCQCQHRGQRSRRTGEGHVPTCLFMDGYAYQCQPRECVTTTIQPSATIARDHHIVPHADGPCHLTPDHHCQTCSSTTASLGRASSLASWIFLASKSSMRIPLSRQAARRLHLLLNALQSCRSVAGTPTHKTRSSLRSAQSHADRRRTPLGCHCLWSLPLVVH